MKGDREVRIYEEVQRVITVMALSDSHAEDEALVMEPVRQNLFFEGFLEKRKDTMKFTWSKYWFKLQNTTLYFYIKKESQPMSLRSQYYMYSVQSVRSVTSTDKDFPFEIVMKNGKRKLLSAASEEQREVWIKLLWKSMQLPGPGRHNSSCTWYDVPELVERGNSVSGDSDQVGLSPDSSMNDNVFEKPQEPEEPLSGDSDQVGLSPDSSMNDNVFEQPQEPEEPAGNESDPSSDSELYDVPRPQKDTSVPPCGNESDPSSDSELYDVPRPQKDTSVPPCDPVEEHQYESMCALQPSDSPTSTS